MKDNFSIGSDKYAIYRPEYPDSVVNYIVGITEQRESVWDCATGNGQFAKKLSPHFKSVYATDISQSQIDNAAQFKNINYSIQPAEKTTFPDNFFNLITVAQAIHWFNFDSFYQEVYRTIRKDGHLAVIGYGLIRISPELDEIIDYFYKDIIGSYWDKERKYVDEGYKTIPFPYKEIYLNDFSQTIIWTIDHLIGYLGTWSSVKHYQQKNGHNPIDRINENLKLAWGSDACKSVNFPILLRIGSDIKA